MWLYRKEEGWKTGIIDNESGTTICEVYNHQEEKAQKLVDAANSQVDLLEAFQCIPVPPTDFDTDEGCQAYAEAIMEWLDTTCQAAIAKATNPRKPA